MSGAAADNAAFNKEAKYRQLANSYIFVPVAIDSRVLEPPSSGTGAGAGPTNDSRHWRHQGNNIPVPAAVGGSPTGKCGLLPQHFQHRVNAVVVLLA